MDVIRGKAEGRGPSTSSLCPFAAKLVRAGPFNGSALLAKTVTGEIAVALHKRCEALWADKNNCETLVLLKKMRRSGNGLRYSEARKTA
jgi:hypothetical protein